MLIRQCDSKISGIEEFRLSPDLNFGFAEARGVPLARTTSHDTETATRKANVLLWLCKMSFVGKNIIIFSFENLNFSFDHLSLSFGLLKSHGR